MYLDLGAPSAEVEQKHVSFMSKGIGKFSLAVHQYLFLEQWTVKGERLKFSAFTTNMTTIFFILHCQNTTEHDTVMHITHTHKHTTQLHTIQYNTTQYNTIQPRIIQPQPQSHKTPHKGTYQLTQSRKELCYSLPQVLFGAQS